VARAEHDEEPIMPSVFSRIIDGELPARFVWRDDEVVAFLSANPISPGHSLVVPRQAVDHWIDLDPALWARCAEVALIVGQAIQRAFDPPRVGQAIAGFEVPHTHIHVLQLRELADLSFENAATDPDQSELDDAAERIRTALRELGHDDQVG
jgi:diadenosine tetraphosphate (Ap4A) HIT family hydrolase